MPASEHQVFLALIERCLDEGTFLFRKPQLVRFSQNDPVALMLWLAELEAEGAVQFLIPWESAKEDDNVVRVPRYLTRKGPWPNWPPVGPLSDEP